MVIAICVSVSAEFVSILLYSLLLYFRFTEAMPYSICLPLIYHNAFQVHPCCCVAKLHSFFMSEIVFPYTYTTLSLSVHLFMGIGFLHILAYLINNVL